MTAILTPRPRAEYELSTPLDSSPYSVSSLTRWGRQNGSDTGKIIAPETMNPARRFSPINMLLVARRDQGKSLTTTAILNIYHRAFWNPALGVHRGVRRVGSNYFVRFAQEAGPLGYERGYIETEDGDVRPGMIPVDPCDQRLPDKLTEFPIWGRHRLIGIDEIADVLNSGMANSRLVRDWSSVLRQQRKMFTEFLANTQFPWQVAQNAITNQIDLIAYVVPHYQTWSVDLLIHDIHGQFTGDWGKYAGRWPTLNDQPSWEIGVGGLQYVKDEYNTFEIIEPTWKKNRGALIERQYRNRSTWAAAEYAILDDVPEVVSEEKPKRRKRENLDPAATALRALGPIFTFADARAALRPMLGAQVRSNAGLEEWLVNNGWQVYEDNGERMVRR